MANKWVCISQSERDYLFKILGEEKSAKSLMKKLKDVDKTIKVSSRKGKGRNLQQWVCERISVLTGIKFNNQDDSCLIHSREMGQHGTDVVLRGEAKEKFPFAIECKNVESINLRAFVDQAKANNKEDTDWLLVIRTKSIPETLAVIAWETLEKLYRRNE